MMWELIGSSGVAVILFVVVVFAVAFVMSVRYAAQADNASTRRLADAHERRSRADEAAVATRAAVQLAANRPNQTRAVTFEGPVTVNQVNHFYGAPPNGQAWDPPQLPPISAVIELGEGD